MSAPKFTAGPWTFSIGGTGDYPTWGVRIGKGLVHLPGIEPMEVMDANARLIAAAPEMYEALEAMVGIEDDDEYMSQLEVNARLEAARAALAKARGEA